MKIAVASNVVAAHGARVIDAPHFGQIGSVVRLSDRRAEAAVPRAEETVRRSGRIEVNAGNDTTVIYFLRPGQIPGPRIIEGLEHFDRLRPSQASNDGERQ